MTAGTDIELVDAVRALRTELERAMIDAEDASLQFETMDVQMEFHVGITRSLEVSTGLKFWVLELGGKGAQATETVQTVTLSLKPVLTDGRPVRITRAATGSPLAGPNSPLTD